MGWTSCIEDTQTRLDDFINQTQGLLDKSRPTSSWNKAEIDKICKVVQDTQHVLSEMKKAVNAPGFEIEIAFHEAKAENERLLQEKENKAIQIQRYLIQLKKSQETIEKLNKQLKENQRTLKRLKQESNKKYKDECSRKDIELQTYLAELRKSQETIARLERRQSNHRFSKQQSVLVKTNAKVNSTACERPTEKAASLGSQKLKLRAKTCIG